MVTYTYNKTERKYIDTILVHNFYQNVDMIYCELKQKKVMGLSENDKQTFIIYYSRVMVKIMTKKLWS